MSAIDDAVRAAEAQAANATAAVLPATTQASGAVATVMPQGRKITTEDTVGGSMNVDDFIKFSDMGTVVLKGKQFEKIRVMLDMTEIVPSWGVRYGDPAVYERTMDMVTSTRGGSWEDAVARAARVSPKNKPYNAWDLPFVLLEDQGELKAGARVGYSTVWSSFKTFKPMFDKAVAQFGKNATIEVVISCKGINAPGKKYGEAQWELIGEVGQD